MKLSVQNQMKLSPKKRAFKALLGGKPDRAPVTSFTGCGGSVNVEIIGNVSSKRR
jgi:hypothetical protein